MKILIFLSLLLVCAVIADHDNAPSTSTEETQCDAEITRIRDEVRKIINDDTFEFLKVYRKFNKLDKGLITEDDFNTFIDDFCPKAVIAVQGVLERIPTISEECQATDEIKIKLNQIRFYEVLFNKLCTDDAKGYKDLVKNNGVKCFMDNSDLNECWETHGMVYMDKNNYKGENICKFVKVMIDCSEHLDKCDNKDVKTISTEVHTALNEKLHCNTH